MVYIYALRCPVANSIRYIGKAEDIKLRLSRHIATARTKQAKHHCARWIRTLLAQGLEPTIEVVRVIADDEDWREIERQVIAEYRAAGHPLTNQTVGGDGVSYINNEDRAGASTKLAVMMTRAWADPAKRERLLNGARNPELLKRRADAMNARHADPEFVAKKMAGVMRAARDPDILARLREVAARPEVRAAKVAANKAKSPEVRARQAAKMREWHARARRNLANV